MYVDAGLQLTPDGEPQDWRASSLEDRAGVGAVS